MHHWLKALRAEHDVDFLLVDPIADQRRQEGAQDCPARVIDLGVTPSCTLARRASRKGWSLLSRTPAAALIAMPRRAVEYVRQAVKEGRYDLAIVWASPVAGYALLLQELLPTVICQLSVEALNARDQRRRTSLWHPRWALEEWIMRRFEAKTCRAATAICTVNGEDAEEFVRRYRLTNLVQCIPVGVDLAKFAPREQEPGGKVIGFVGNFNWGANVDGFHWLAREIAPRVLAVHPDARFRVIGPGSETLRKAVQEPQFQFTGYVADVRNKLADVVVGLVPVFSGTGMRLKLLELLSMGIPAVTTSLGAAGVRCVHGEHALVADDTAAFAGAVNALLSDSVLRQRLSKSGPELAKQYSWESIEETVRVLIRKTAATAGKSKPVKAKAANRPVAIG